MPELGTAVTRGRGTNKLCPSLCNMYVDVMKAKLDHQQVRCSVCYDGLEPTQHGQASMFEVSLRSSNVSDL